MTEVISKKRIVFVLITILFFSRAAMALNFAVDVSGAPFCVDHSGSGGNFTTLIAAMTAANVAGGPHTIDICPGTYTAQAGAINNANYAGLTIRGVTAAGSPLNVNAANVIVNPTGNNEVFDIRQPNITIQGLTADSAGANNDAIEIRGNSASILNVQAQNPVRDGILIINSTGVLLSNVRVFAAQSEGIYANAGSTGLIINSADSSQPNTDVTGTGATDECIDVDAADANIDDVDVDNCELHGIRIDGANATLDNITVNDTGREGILLNGLAPLLNQDDTVNNTISITNTTREGIRSTNNADNAIIDNITVNTTGRECAEHQGDGDGVTVNFQNYDLSNCGLEGLFLRSPSQVADTIKVDTTVGGGRECMEVDGANAIVTNLDLDNCAGIGLRLDGAGVSATTIDINTTGNIGLRFDGANVTVTSAIILNTNSYGLLVSGNDGTVSDINIRNVNNTGMRVENSRADIDNVDISDTRIHGVQITGQDADINTLSLTNIGTYLAGSGGADGITTTNRRMDLTNITINDARDFGIHYNTTNNNTTSAVSFSNITITNTGDDGMFINRSRNNFVMDTINVSNASQDGIRINRGDRLTLSNLTVSNNTLDGVVFFLSRRSTLSNSTIDSNQDGIVIERSRVIEVSDSTISNNSNRGIMLLTQNNNTTDEARNNLIHDNLITGNTNFGLRIFNNATADNDANQIYENCFNNPSGVNARDDETIGSPAANSFDVGARGNFWDDDSVNSPGFSDSCTDVVVPIGICDTTYPIPNAGNSVDNSPLKVCGVIPPVDHYDIDFSATTGITCAPLSVTITAKDASNNTVVHSAATTIDLETSTSLGSWVSVSTGTGTLNDVTLGDGVADYEFPPGESTVTLVFNYTDLSTPPTDTVSVNIVSTPNETTGVAAADVDPGDGTDDPSVDFSLAGFIFNNVSAISNTIPTQLSGKDSDVGFNAVTLNIQAVRTSDDDPTVCQGIFANATVVSVELGAECKDPDVCDTVVLPNGPGSELEITNAAPATSGGVNIATRDDDSVATTIAAYTPVDLLFGATSEATIVLNYPDAGSLELHARYELLLDDLTPSGNYAVGISNSFVVRPFGFDIDSGGLRAADWADNSALDDSTSLNISYAADATGSMFAKAGHSTNTFPLTLRAVVWESADDGNNDGVPDTGVDLTDNSTTPNFGQEGATDDSELVNIVVSNIRPTNIGSLFFGEDLDFVNGEITTNLAFDEVGIIDLTASIDADPALPLPGDGVYLNSAQSITTIHQDFGRFVPDQFLLVDNNPTFTNTCTVGGSFTYMDEIIEYTTAPEITITAVNENGDTTINYGDGGSAATDYWKLPTSLSRSYSDNGVNNGTSFADSVSLLDPGTVTISGDDNYDGVGILTIENDLLDTADDGDPRDRDYFMFDRSSVDLNALEGGPFTASVDLRLLVTASSLTDTDGVCYDGDADGTCETDGSDDYLDMTNEIVSGTPIMSELNLRFGRFDIGSAVGSELLTLTPLLITEYFDGTRFIPNTDTLCTAIDLADHVRLDNTGTPVAGNSSMTIGSGSTSITTFNDPLAMGDTGTVFSAPGEGNLGFVNIGGNLGCNILPACVGDNLNHLRFDWDDLDGNDDGPYDDEPSGRIDFGLFKGPDSFIYIREPW